MAEEIIGARLVVEGGDQAAKTVGELRAELQQAAEASKAMEGNSKVAQRELDAARTSAKDIAAQLQQAGANASKMADGVAKADAPVKSVKAQLKEATANLIAMQQEFGALSPEALNAARSVAELRDNIQEANEVAGLFDPGKAFGTVVGVGSAIAAGFSAAQGAMALLGTESKEVEKAILKVQAAMALAQGLSTIRDSAKEFQRLGAIIQSTTIYQRALAAANSVTAATMRAFGFATTQTGTAFVFLRGAIIATGLGALAVVIGMVVNKLTEFTSKTDEATEAQKKLTEAQEEAARKIKDAALQRIKDNESLLVAIAKAEGKSAAEIAEIQRNSLSEQRKWLLAYATEETKTLEEKANAAAEFTKLERESEIKKYDDIAKAREEAEKKAKAAADKTAAAQKQAAADRKSQLAAAAQAERQTADEIFALRNNAEAVEIRALQQRFDERKATYAKVGKDTSSLVAAFEEEKAAIVKKYADIERERQNALWTEKVEQEEQERQMQLQRTEFEKQQADARQQVAEREKNAKLQTAAAVANGLNSFAELAGEATVTGKVLAIASATVSTYLSAQQAFTAMSGIPIVGPALGAVAAAAAVAAGIVNIKKIVSVKVPGKGGGGSAPAISSAAPITPAANTQPSVTQIDQASINQMGNATVKAVVVESDITNSQDRINRIHNASKIE